MIANARTAVPPGRKQLLHQQQKEGNSFNTVFYFVFLFFLLSPFLLLCLWVAQSKEAVKQQDP